GSSSEPPIARSSRSAGEADWGLRGLTWGLRGHGLLEKTAYARPNEVFFDNRLLRVELAGSRRIARSWDVELRPRLEWLSTTVGVGEAYRQASLVADFSRLRG